MSNEIESYELEIYISYERLTATSLGVILASLGDIADQSSRLYADYVGLDEESLPTLEILTSSTGESIKIKFGEGLLPEISIEGSLIPPKIGASLIIVSLVLGIGLEIQDLRIKQNLIELQKIEIQLKKSELAKALMKNEKALFEMQGKAKNIVSFINNNKDFKEFKVNGIDIKKPEERGTPEEQKTPQGAPTATA
ncbi:MAG: hypothetical protein V3T30_06605 [Thermodesulfobacteriota bacterium]